MSDFIEQWSFSSRTDRRRRSLVPLFLLELVTDWPVLKALLGQFSDDLAKQAAYVYLIYQAVAAVLIALV